VSLISDRRISASFLKTWSSCPQKGYFRYVEGIADDESSGKQVFGTVMHLVLEEARELTTFKQAIQLFDYYWDDPGLIGEKIDYWHQGHSREGLRKKAHKSLEMIWEMKSITDSTTRDILAREHRFLVPMGGYTLTGVVDLVELAPGKKIKIVDYKSASRKPTKAELAFDIQFTTYDYASWSPFFWLGNPEDYDQFPPITDDKEWVDEVTTMYKRQLIWFHLMTGQEVGMEERGEKDYARLYYLIQQIDKAVQNESQVPDISADTCRYCAYTDICPATKGFDEELEDAAFPTYAEKTPDKIEF